MIARAPEGASGDVLVTRRTSGQSRKTWDSDTALLILKIVAELLDGERHSRHTVHRATGRSLGTADRWMRWIAGTIPGARLEKDGKTTWLLIKGRSALPSRTAAYGACVAASLASLFAGTAHERNVREARDYILWERGMRFDDIDRKLVFCARSGDSALPERGAELDDVIDATLRSVRLGFRYRHGRSGESRTYDVEPLSVLIFDHQFYVLARRPDGSYYPFRFARMEAIEPLSERFEYPGKGAYDPRELLDAAFGIHIAGVGRPQQLELQLSGPWADFAKTHRWHSTQRLASDASDGSVRLTMTVPLCPEVNTWLLGFGDAAEVVSPASLRREIVGTLRRALTRYAKVSAKPVAKARSRRSHRPTASGE